MIHKNTHQTIKFGLAKEETSKSEFNGTLKLEHRFKTHDYFLEACQVNDPSCVVEAKLLTIRGI